MGESIWFHRGELLSTTTDLLWWPFLYFRSGSLKNLTHHLHVCSCPMLTLYRSTTLSFVRFCLKQLFTISQNPTFNFPESYFQFLRILLSISQSPTFNFSESYFQFIRIHLSISHYPTFNFSVSNFQFLRILLSISQNPARIALETLPVLEKIVASGRARWHNQVEN